MCCSSSTTRMRLMPGLGARDSAVGTRRSTRVSRDQSWKFEGERRAAALALALREDASPVRARDRTHDVETEPGAFHLREAARLHAVEAAEDPLQLLARDA